jgi:hypothetical protein
MSIKQMIMLHSLVVTLLVGCGSGGEDTDSNSQSSATMLTGQFIDAPVANVTYYTDSHSGVTDENGYFYYEPGESVTFKIGNITLGTSVASTLITPLDIAGTSNSEDPEVINMLRFLQSLDEDGNPENGIYIHDDVKSSAQQEIVFDRDENEFENDHEVQALISSHNTNTGSLVSTEEALAHFSEQLNSANIIASPLVGAWTLDNTQYNDNELLVYLFMDNGNYINVTLDNQASMGYQFGNGLEFGQYQLESNTLYQQASYYDENRLSGLSNSLSSSQRDAGISGTYITYTFVDNEHVSLTFERYDSGIVMSTWTHQLIRLNKNAENLLQGAWLFYKYDINNRSYGESEDFAYLFLDNNQYIKIEVEDDSYSNDIDGAEWGSYSIDNVTGRLLLSEYGEYNYHGDDGNDYLSAKVNGDVLMLTEHDDGRENSTVFYRQ